MTKLEGIDNGSHVEEAFSAGAQTARCLHFAVNLVLQGATSVEGRQGDVAAAAGGKDGGAVGGRGVGGSINDAHLMQPSREVG